MEYIKQFEGYQPSKRNIFDVQIGDFVGNTHGQFGKVVELDDRRCRAAIEHAEFSHYKGYYEYSITGDTARDTLCINGYIIYEPIL